MDGPPLYREAVTFRSPGSPRFARHPGLPVPIHPIRRRRFTRAPGETRLKEEYQRNMANLEQSLELLAVEQHELREEPSGSYQMEIHQLEAERLKQQIDEVCDMLARLKLMQGSASRIELVSRAEIPISREEKGSGTFCPAD